MQRQQFQRGRWQQLINGHPIGVNDDGDPLCVTGNNAIWEP
ncbi:hypothetical protein [Levilactobacillus brevis]